MFQSFDVAADPANVAPRLTLLRQELGRRGLTGFLVPWVANRFGWWLQPAAHWNALAVHFLGAGVILAIYAAMIFVFWRFF